MGIVSSSAKAGEQAKMIVKTEDRERIAILQEVAGFLKCK